MKKLNSTISELQSQKDSSAAPPNINEDLALLKKGMADTGVDIKKLSDENEATEKTVTLLSKLVRSLKKDVSELKVICFSSLLLNYLYLYHIFIVFILVFYCDALCYPNEMRISFNILAPVSKHSILDIYFYIYREIKQFSFVLFI